MCVCVCVSGGQWDSVSLSSSSSSRRAGLSADCFYNQRSQVAFNYSHLHAHTHTHIQWIPTPLLSPRCCSQGLCKWGVSPVPEKCSIFKKWPFCLLHVANSLCTYWCQWPGPPVQAREVATTGLLQCGVNIWILMDAFSSITVYYCPSTSLSSQWWQGWPSVFCQILNWR